MNAIPAKIEAQLAASLIALTYDCIADAMPARYHRAHELQNLALIQAIRNNPNPRLLEVGPGTCRDIVRIRNLASQKCIHWTGIEQSTAMIEVAESAGRLQDGQLNNIITGDAFDFRSWDEINSRSYDICFSSFVMHHYNKEQRTWMYQNMLSRVDAGGVLIVTDLFAFGYDMRRMQEVEVRDIGATVNTACLPSHIDREALFNAWTQHYLHENRPPPLLSEIEILERLGFEVSIEMCDVQVAVLVGKKRG